MKIGIEATSRLYAKHQNKVLGLHLEAALISISLKKGHMILNLFVNQVHR